MKSWMIVAALAAAVAVPASAADEHKGHKAAAAGGAVTVEGELLDLACYLAHEGKGEKHAKCAEMCVKGGAPLGIEGKDGKVYLLVNDHGQEKAFAEAKTLAGKRARVTGKVLDRGGLKALQVHKAEKL